MNTVNISKYEISTDCQCRYCEQCGMGTESEQCEECQQDTRPMEYCDGQCWEYMRDWFEEDIQRFIDANGNPSHVRIDGQKMGWQSRSGYKVVEADHKAIWDALTFSGDWTLYVTCDGPTMTIRRTSHDEPMGATFTLTPSNEEEYDA